MLDCGIVERNKEEAPKGRRRLRYDDSNMNEMDHITEASDNKWLSRV
jgi:predicted transcriptional regulator